MATDYTAEIAAFITNYFASTPPATWHAVMREYSYGKLYPVASWLIENPQTEKATILMLYWMMHPRFSKQFDVEEVKAKELEAFNESYHELIEELEAKYLSGFYTNATVGYSPYYDYTKESLGLMVPKRKIPMEMFSPVGGMEFDFYGYNRDHKLHKGFSKDHYNTLTLLISGEPTANENAEPAAQKGATDVSQEAQADSSAFDFSLHNENEAVGEEGQPRVYAKADRNEDHGYEDSPASSDYEVVNDSPEANEEAAIAYTTHSYAANDLKSIVDAEIEQIILDYIKTVSDPKVWHILIYFYDYTPRITKVATWLIAQPELEKATALILYWKLQPYFSKQFTDPTEARNKELAAFGEIHYNLIKLIEHKYLDNDFKETINLSFNPEDYDSHNPLGIVAKIPLEMYQGITNGVSFDEEEMDDYDNKLALFFGMPKELYDRIEKLEDSLAESTTAGTDQKGLSPKQKSISDYFKVIFFILAIITIIARCSR